MTKETYKTKTGLTQFRPIISESELMEERSAGFCLACGEEAFSVEPDARRYECEACGKQLVFGLEELVMMGLAKITAEA